MDIFSTSWGLVEGLGSFSFNAKEANLISRYQLGKWEVAHCCNHEFADSSCYLIIFVVLCHWSRVCLMLSALKNQTKVIYPIFLTVGTRKCSLFLSCEWLSVCGGLVGSAQCIRSCYLSKTLYENNWNLKERVKQISDLVLNRPIGGYLLSHLHWLWWLGITPVKTIHHFLVTKKLLLPSAKYSVRSP